MTFRLLAFTLSLSILPLVGQALAKQGTETDLKLGAFTSPMVLELPLDRLKVEEPGNLYAFTDQDKFVCDGVSLPIILITKTTTWSKHIKLTIKATAYVQPSYDRKVWIQGSLLGGAGPVGPRIELEISAKEKKHRSDSASLELSQEVFEGLFKDGQAGKLKLIVTVTPDR